MSVDSEDDGTSSDTSGRMTGRIEVVGRVSGRRRWTVEQKLAIPQTPLGLAVRFGPPVNAMVSVNRTAAHGLPWPTGTE